MHPRAQEFADRVAERYGLEVDIHEFDAGTKTAADAAEVVGCDVAQIASGLVFVADGEPIMVIASGANRVDESRLADIVGAESVAMADPETVREATGFGIGGVPPIAHDRELRTLLDETLLDHDTVWAAAGTPEAIFPIDPDQLVELADATAIAVAD